MTTWGSQLSNVRLFRVIMILEYVFCTFHARAVCVGNYLDINGCTSNHAGISELYWVGKVYYLLLSWKIPCMSYGLWRTCIGACISLRFPSIASFCHTYLNTAEFWKRELVSIVPPCIRLDWSINTSPHSQHLDYSRLYIRFLSCVFPYVFPLFLLVFLRKFLHAKFQT